MYFITFTRRIQFDMLTDTCICEISNNLISRLNKGKNLQKPRGSCPYQKVLWTSQFWSTTNLGHRWPFPPSEETLVEYNPRQPFNDQCRHKPHHTFVHVECLNQIPSNSLTKFTVYFDGRLQASLRFFCAHASPARPAAFCMPNHNQARLCGCNVRGKMTGVEAFP